MDRVCGHLETLVRGRYLLFNNLWGAATGAGTQCLSAPDARDPDEPLAWETTWGWAGDPDTVKSYVAAVVGWHFGWPAPACELPVALADIEAVPSRWEFDLRVDTRSPVRLNVSYDIWLARTPEAEVPDVTDEVMIWVHRVGGPTPIGSQVGEVDIEGARWELWEGPHPDRGWTVHSFVRVESANEMALEFDLRRFFDALAGTMSDARYLVGVQAGPEVFEGSGEFNVKAYSVNVRLRTSR